MLARNAALLAWGLLLTGCGGGGSDASGSASSTSSTPAPVISITDPSSGTVDIAQEPGSTKAVNIYLHWTDTDANASSATFLTYNSNNLLIDTATYNLPATPGQTTGTSIFIRSISTSAATTYSIRITATDSAKNVSNEVSLLVRVVPSNLTAAVVAATGLQPSYLTAVGGSLYWTERGHDAIKSAPTSGGSASVRATRMINPTALAFVGSDMIWLDVGPRDSVWNHTCDPSSRAIKRTNPGGTTLLLATGGACNVASTDAVIDGTSVYWASADAPGEWGAINVTPISGGTSQKIFSTDSASIAALAARSGTLYWMDRISRTYGDGAIHSLTFPGGANTLVSDINVVSNTFAVDDTAVYYASSDNGSTSGPSTLWAQPLSGGTPIALATSLATPIKIIAAAGKVLWIDATSVNSVDVTGGGRATLATTANTPISLMVNGSEVIWSESTGTVHGETGSLKSVPVAGGAVMTLYQGGAAPRQLAIDGSGRINWTEGGSVGMTEGFARIARLTASNVETVLTGIATEAARFVATSSDLYIADAWQIKRLPLNGGLPQIISVNDGPIGFIAVDASSVYWTSSINASVHRAPISGGLATTLISSDAVGTQATPISNLQVTSSGALVWGVGSPYIRRIVSIPASAPSTTASIVADINNFPINIMTDSSYAYFDTGAFTLSKAPLSGGGIVSLAPINNPPLATVMDGSTIYWLVGHGIGKVPVSGGSNTMVLLLSINSGNWVSNLAVDDSRVYWTDFVNQRIMATPK